MLAAAARIPGSGRRGLLVQPLPTSPSWVHGVPGHDGEFEQSLVVRKPKPKKRVGASTTRENRALRLRRLIRRYRNERCDLPFFDQSRDCAAPLEHTVRSDL